MSLFQNLPKGVDYRLFKDEGVWLDMRKNYITSTDLVRFLGLDSGISRRKFFESKYKGIDPLEEKKHADPVLKYKLDFGKKHENDALLDFMIHFNKKMKLVDKQTFFYHQENLVSGTTDAIFEDFENEQMIVVEIKTKCSIGPDSTEESTFPHPAIEMKHFIQLSIYLLLTGFEFGYLVSWTLMNGFNIFLVKKPNEQLRNFLMYYINDLKKRLKVARESEENYKIVLKGMRMRRFESPSIRSNIRDFIKDHCLDIGSFDNLLFI